MTISRAQDTVTVEVADDAPATGSRASASPGRSRGLASIRQRIERLGGSYRAGPDPGCGWSVRATMPVDGQHAGCRPRSGNRHRFRDQAARPRCPMADGAHVPAGNAIAATGPSPTGILTPVCGTKIPAVSHPSEVPAPGRAAASRGRGAVRRSCRDGAPGRCGGFPGSSGTRARPCRSGALSAPSIFSCGNSPTRCPACAPPRDQPASRASQAISAYSPAPVVPGAPST